jgi:hypothetical protein
MCALALVPCPLPMLNSHLLSPSHLLHPSRMHPVPASCSCFVCGKRMLDCFLDTCAMTLGEFIDVVVKGKLGFNVPNLSLGATGLCKPSQLHLPAWVAPVA